MVRDNGSGIPLDMLESIFEMITQVNDTARAAQGGLGICLTLVRSLVELHHGHVHGHSDGPGQGSVFEVVLPLAAPAEAVPNAHQPLQGVGRLLVVDDNRDTADSLSALLEILGAETAVAYGGPQALELVARFRPAVAILDIGMPGMDGHQLAAQLRSDPAHAGLVLIALSGWKAEDGLMHAAQPAEHGFDHHLLKPPDIDRLTKLLAAVAVRRPD